MTAAIPARIGFLGFGEAARAFQSTLKARHPGLTFWAYDIKLDDADATAPMRAAMLAAGVTPLDAPGALGGLSWVFSAVTADQSLQAVAALAPGLRGGETVLDVNSVSPERKRVCAEIVGGRGARYVDMAVMAPVLPRGHATPTLIACDQAEVVMSALAALGFSAELAGDEPGAATAVKMVRSLFVKGLEAITAQALMGARASGCYETVLASISASYPGLGWPDFADYQFERMLRHGVRRAAEMRESAAAFDDLGLGGGLAREIAEVHERLGRLGAAPGPDLAATVDAALDRR
jgi:3-hydroxyisobutyrate dehydrogenase-like beta-hydroxyacid dehydrogenase